MRQYSEACERNKEPILEVIKPYLSHSKKVLEIGSGTGQHAVHFAAALPHLTWQTSDLRANHASIIAWIEQTQLPNLRKPFTLDAARRYWDIEPVDAIFTANTAHIMAWDTVKSMFTGIGKNLKPGGHFLLYGPFNVGGNYTSPSNQQFDQSLKKRDPESAIRDYEDILSHGRYNGLSLLERHQMPANNMLLVFQKTI
ncbi:DUF938 domain-containing protein [Kangiella sp. TOML190]|uniref:DUF938 domain-containing protein n=1 Tax=Kangiella sp. TOML190 TaxID=2931351 RepID=UPI00204083A8|nr:DUF938 domain-containing protein [Kangiella sp. TOML190]